MRELSILGLLSEDRQLVIPRFQRGFEWQEANWEDYWNDLLGVAVEGNRRHFLGVIILCNETKTSEKYRNVEIIDGQQRLITTSIFVRAVYDRWKDSSTANAATLFNQYIQGGRFDIPYFKIVLNEREQDFFRKWIQEEDADRRLKGKRIGEKRIRSCYEYFSRKIGEVLEDKNVEEAGTVLEKIITRCQTNAYCIVIETKEDADAYSMFETINSKKVELTASDLLKNFLFSRAAEQTKKKLHDIEDSWMEMQNKLEENKAVPSSYIRHLWISTNEKVGERDLYRTIKNKYHQNSTALMKFAKQMFDESEKYTQILNPRGNELLTKKSIGFLFELNKLGVRQCYPLILSALAVDVDSETLNSLLRTIIVVSFRRSVSGQNPNALEKVYAETARQLRDTKGAEIQTILGKIIANNVSDELFMAQFVETDWDSATAKYFLEQYQDSIGPLDVTVKDVSLEHVLPQKPEDLADWDLTQADHEALVNKIGNLTLVGQTYNAKMKNKKYSVKRVILRDETGVTIASQIAKLYPEKWGKDEILDRGKKLADFANDRWKIN